MKREDLLVPIRFRFTDPDDVKTYTDEWITYSEADLVHLPVDKLVELESVLGLTIPRLMNLWRGDSVLGTLAGCWVALHLANPEMAGPWEEFKPMIMLLEWSKVPAEPSTGDAEVDLGKEQSADGSPEPTPDRTSIVSLDLG